MLQIQTPQSSSSSSSSINSNSTAFYCLSFSAFFSILFILSLSSSPTTNTPTPTTTPDPRLFPNLSSRYVLNPHPTLPNPPSIAYFISGSSGDGSRIFRLLLAVYHPRNVYLLHLDRVAKQEEREKLALRVQGFEVFKAAQNVHVVGKADFVYAKGSSPVSSLLRGAAILLKLSNGWDWFINLSARDYPLVTPDDLLHIMSYLPKDLNFVNHTSYIGWRESRRLKPIIVDPGLYLKDKAAMFYGTQKRELPNAYQLFSGSSTSILTRKFVEFSILGSDNLPRLLLMYLANTPSALLNYFPTLVCNSPEFRESAVNHNLQYGSYYTSSKEEPRKLNVSDLDDMIQSGAAFATQFGLNDLVLGRIDQEILGRKPGKVVPGGWCLGGPNDTCAVWGDASILRPGPGAKRLEKRIVELLSNGTYRSQQCIVE